MFYKSKSKSIQDANDENQKMYIKEITYGREDDDWGDVPAYREVLSDCSNCGWASSWCTCSDSEKRAMRKKAREKARTKSGDKMFRR